jgi:predicted nucleic acid-binding protein
LNHIVIDASITLAWCFTDEQTPLSLQILGRLNGGDQAVVPLFWKLEVLNSFLVGERRGRISSQQTRAFLDALSGLRPVYDHASAEGVNGPVQKLCRDHGLTPYDALYIELAIRKGCPLATQDQNQKEAALTLGVDCL